MALPEFAQLALGTIEKLAPGVLTQDQASHLVSVRGTLFVVEDSLLPEMGEFMQKLLDPTSPFSTPEDGIFDLDVDPESFSTILHYTRYKSLNFDAKKSIALLTAADFLGVRDKINQALASRNADYLKSFTAQFSTLKFYFDSTLKSYFDDSGVSSAIESWTNSWICLYTKCALCHKQIKYSEIVGWCHKCSRCESCQRRGSCLNDNPYGDYCHNPIKTKRKIEANGWPLFSTQMEAAFRLSLDS
jgi:hypothetical protein